MHHDPPNLYMIITHALQHDYIQSVVIFRLTLSLTGTDYISTSTYTSMRRLHTLVKLTNSTHVARIRVRVHRAYALCICRRLCALRFGDNKWLRCLYESTPAFCGNYLFVSSIDAGNNNNRQICRFLESRLWASVMLFSSIAYHPYSGAHATPDFPAIKHNCGGSMQSRMSGA